MLDRLLDHKADEHFFEEVHAPIFDLCIELLMRNIEKVSQLLGVVEPEKVRKSERHEHLERDEIAFAKLVMKEGEKPGKFLLPHGILLLEFGPYRIFMEGNPEGIQNQRPLGIMELSVYINKNPSYFPFCVLRVSYLLPRHVHAYLPQKTMYIIMYPENWTGD